MIERPWWIKVRVPTPKQAQGMADVRRVLAEHRLETVCQAARCPNAAECWSQRTATFMILGCQCTRSCRFCDVPSGNPQGLIDPDEPTRLAAGVQALAVKHVVLTSVDRDDLSDGGAKAFAETIRAVANVPGVETVEALIPDFSGDPSSLDRIVSENVAVIGHNLETVRRLTPSLRDPRASYGQSLAVLRYLSQTVGGRRVKSGVMVGLGETPAEIDSALKDLRHAGVSIVTIGQYLQPSSTEVPVQRYVRPEEFLRYERTAKALGFSAVIAGPRVRSSYHAAEACSSSCELSST